MSEYPATVARRARARISGVGFSIPLLGIETTLELNRSEREAAWKFLVELVTRTAIVSSGDGEGSDAAVLSSLYSLFGTAREVLKEHGVDTGADHADGSLSFATVSVRVLNEILRPFTTKWHPVLEAHAAACPDGTGAADWERNGIRKDGGPQYDHRGFRRDLAIVQARLRDYIFELSRAAGTNEFGSTVLADVRRMSGVGRAVRASIDVSAAPLNGKARHRMVRWFDPIELLMSWRAIRQGKLDDRVATSPPPDSEPPERGEGPETWFDYVADMGDAFDPTMQVAWTLGRCRLTEHSADGTIHDLPRGEILVLGGDEIYPYASAVGYQNQLVAPYERGFEPSPFDAAAARPTVYAVPGNHDWYGGLSHWRAVFCGADSFAGWDAPQTTSWWAKGLTHGWWLWGIDTHLDGTIDDAQWAYFQRASEALKPGDQVILCTPVPLWRLRETKPERLAEIETFVEAMIDARGACARVYLSGDSHIFASYLRERKPGVIEYHVTSGGGGAFLQPTHNLAAVVPQTRIESSAEADVDPAPFVDGRFWPDPSDTHAQVRGRWMSAIRDRQSPTLAALVAILHVLYGGFGGRGVRSEPLSNGLGGIVNVAHRFVATKWGLGATAAMLVVALAACWVAARPNTSERLVRRAATRIGLGHGLIQAVVFFTTAVGVHWLVWQVCGDEWRTRSWLVAALIGGVVGGLASVLLLLAALLFANRHYRINDNEAFASRHFVDAKHFLRCHIDERGRLTIRLIAIDTVRRGWATAIADKAPLPPGSRATRDGRTRDTRVADVRWSSVIRPHIEPVRFTGMAPPAVAVSISDPPPGEGEDERQVHERTRRVFELVADAVLANGFDIVYGGDHRLGGFTQQLVELARESATASTNRIHNYLRSIEYQAGLAGFIQGVDVVEVRLPEGVVPDGLSDADKTLLTGALQLTEMRRRTSRPEVAVARIVIGGKLGKASGFAPGVLEEAYLSVFEHEVQAPDGVRAKQVIQPLFICGGFGGAARAVANALLTRSIDPATAASFDGVPEYQHLHLLVSGYETASSMLRHLATVTDLQNGLAVDENLELLTTSDVVRVVELVLTGLGRTTIRRREIAPRSSEMSFGRASRNR